MAFYFNFNFSFSTWKIWIFNYYCNRSVYIFSWCYLDFSSLWIDYYWYVFTIFIFCSYLCILIWVINNYASSLFFICWVYWFLVFIIDFCINMNFNFSFSTWKIWIFNYYCNRSVYIFSWCYLDFSSLWIDYCWYVFTIFIFCSYLCILIWVINDYSCALVFICWVYWLLTCSVNSCLLIFWSVIFYCYRYVFFFT